MTIIFLSKFPYTRKMIGLALVTGVIVYILLNIFLLYIDVINYQFVDRSDIPVDVVLVAAEKDFEMIPYSYKSIKKNLMHPINKVVLIAPKTDKAIQLAKSNHFDFIDENELLNLHEFRDIIRENKFELKRKDNWYYQQFLKLYYHKIASSDYYFIMDTDVVLQKPLILVNNDKIHFFYYVDKRHEFYTHFQQSVENILGDGVFFPNFSFVVDFMCFNTETVKTLINKIENDHKKPFHIAAINAEQNSSALFSEYELYGIYVNFIKQHVLVSLNKRTATYRSRHTKYLDGYNPMLRLLTNVVYHKPHPIPDDVIVK